MGLLDTALFWNAIAASCCFICLHAIVILRLYSVTPRKTAFAGFGLNNGFAANFLKFLSGDLLPDLRLRWWLSIFWCVVSFAFLFGSALIDPSG